MKKDSPGFSWGLRGIWDLVKENSGPTPGSTSVLLACTDEVFPDFRQTSQPDDQLRSHNDEFPDQGARQHRRQIRLCNFRSLTATIFIFWNAALFFCFRKPMCCSTLSSQVFQQYKQMSGGGYVGFSNTT